jgi:hypothetical protein
LALISISYASYPIFAAGRLGWGRDASCCYGVKNKQLCRCGIGNTDFLSERQQFVFKGAVLLLCAAILALVFWSGTHETRTSDQCGKADAREGCLADSSATTAYPPAKGALAPAQ